MLQPADLAVIARDPDLPGLALVLDADAVSALLGGAAEPVHLRYKPGVSCMATFRIGPRFVTLRALPRDRFEARELSPRRAALCTFLPDHAVIVMPPAADKRITALRRGMEGAALRYKPERRMVLRQGDAMLKAMSKGTWDRALAGARFGASRGGPAVLAVDEARHLITTEWLPGTSAEAMPHTFARIGAALADLHNSHATLPPLKPLQPPAALDDLEALLPDLAAPMRRLRTLLAATLHDGPAVPCHGDFSADQVMVHDETLTFVDWDEAGMGDPARDLGSFLARLDHDVLTGVRTQTHAEDFLQGYGPLPPNLFAHHAAALAALATEGFRTRRPDWPDLAHRLIARALHIMDPLHIAADPQAMSRLTGLPIRTATVIRHKPGRRALFSYDGTIIGKMRMKGADRRTPALHDRLRQAGLDGTGETGVPSVRGQVEALNLWLQDLVPGRVLTEMIFPAAPDAPFHAAGRALARLHGAAVPAGRDWSMADELAVLHKALDRPDLHPLRDRLTADALSLPAGPTVGIHRDFYPDQALIDGSRVWLLDLDLYAEGDPAIDIGNFLAHLDELALRRGWGCPALHPLGAAFTAGYASLRPLPPHVDRMRALSLARHIHIAGRFEDRRHTPPLIRAHLDAVLSAPAV